MDVSNNRLHGVIAGQAIKTLLTRNIEPSQGYTLQTLNLSNNKIQNEGIEFVFQALSDPCCYLKHLFLKCVEITFVAGIIVVPPVLLLIKTRLETIVLDDNQLRQRSWGRLATLIAMSKSLKHLSLRKCLMDDEMFAGICDVMLLTRKLEKLDMTNNRITDDSIVSFGLVDLAHH